MAPMDCALVLLALCPLIATSPTQNVVPYSGAVFVSGVEPQNQNQNYNPAVAAACPGHAPVGCDSIGHRGWCCPSAQTCVDTPSLSPRVSCCPHGSTCGQVGTVAQQHQPPPNANHNPPGSVVVLGGPVIVQASPEHPVPPSTVFYSPPPTVVQVATPTLAVETEAVVVPAGAVVVAGQSSSLLPGPYCSTLTAKGPGLPTARAGGCGTILVVNTGGRLRPAGDGAGWTWTRDWRIGVIIGSLYLGVIGW